MWLASIAQVVFALIIVILLMVGGFAIYNYELVRATAVAGNLNKTVVIFDGVKDLGINKDEEYDTHNGSSSYFRDLSPSVNQRPGAVYAYNFWLWKDGDAAGFTKMSDISTTGSAKTDAGLVGTDSKILILKGVRKVYTGLKNMCSVPKNDYLTKAPLIKLERGSDVLSVEFNTISSPDVVIEGSRTTCPLTTSSWSSANAHKLSISNFSDPNYNKKWFMVTVVIQDTFPTDALPGRNKVRCQIYINGRLELDRYVDSKFGELDAKKASILQTNTGNLYVAPVDANLTYKMDVAEKLLMANLSYFNYPLTQADVNALYAKGYTNRATNNNIDTTKVTLSQRSAATVGVGLRATSPLIAN